MPIEGLADLAEPNRTAITSSCGMEITPRGRGHCGCHGILPVIVVLLTCTSGAGSSSALPVEPRAILVTAEPIGAISYFPRAMAASGTTSTGVCANIPRPPYLTRLSIAASARAMSRATTTKNPIITYPVSNAVSYPLGNWWKKMPVTAAVPTAVAMR